MRARTVGTDANTAKLLASEATVTPPRRHSPLMAAFAFAKEYDIERKWCEARLCQTAPTSTNLIVAYVGQQYWGCHGRIEPGAGPLEGIA